MEVRSGLPQGSLASPYVASLVMQSLMKCVPASVPRVTFVDDGVIVCASRAEAEAVQSALSKSAKALAGGPVLFKKLLIGRPTVHGSNAVDFLGYRIRKASDGKARATPTPELIKSFISRLKPKLNGVPFADVFGFAQQLGTHWAKSQAAWDYALGENHFMVQVEVVALEVMHFLNKAAHPPSKKPGLSVFKMAKSPSY